MLLDSALIFTVPALLDSHPRPHAEFGRGESARIKLQSGITADMAARYLDSSLASFRMLLSDYQQTDDFNSVMNGVGELLKMLIFGIADK